MMTPEDHYRAFLSSLDLDVASEHLVDTPGRVARFMQTFLLEGEETFRFTTFEADNNDLVVTGRLLFHSMCSHHLVPFFGHAYVGYIPDKRLVGLSKIARALRMVASRPQVQEHLTRQLAEYLNENLQPLGVYVAVYAEHLCMSMRGVRAPGHVTVTDCALGVMQRAYYQTKFFKLISEVTNA